jgi:hypothetical protein
MLDVLQRHQSQVPVYLDWRRQEKEKKRNAQDRTSRPSAFAAREPPQATSLANVDTSGDLNAIPAQS